MKEFKEQRKIQQVIHHFLFRKLISDGHAKYFVKAEREMDAPVFFEMKLDSYSRWKLIPPIPDWIKAIEPELVLLVLEKEQRSV